MAEYPFKFDSKYRPLLRGFGVTPTNSRITVADGELDVRFGPWHLRTPVSNIAGTQRSGPYKAYKAIGVRGSLADSGVTFGTTTDGGLCVLFKERVPGMLPFGLRKHEGMTVTPEDIEGLEQALTQ
ncbi:MAG: hypothetical protein QOG53_3432 [Frankiales bacterium]|nr:hypothetical protein [Frankiales bacterium]